MRLNHIYDVRWGRYFISAYYTSKWATPGDPNWHYELIVSLDEVEGGGTFHNDHPRYHELKNCIEVYFKQSDYAGIGIEEFIQKMLGDPD